jgi:hypothetical protein
MHTSPNSIWRDGIQASLHFMSYSCLIGQRTESFARRALHAVELQRINERYPRGGLCRGRSCSLMSMLSLPLGIHNLYKAAFWSNRQRDGWGRESAGKEVIWLTQSAVTRQRIVKAMRGHVAINRRYLQKGIWRLIIGSLNRRKVPGPAVIWDCMQI